jgi:hypothetical protein
MVTLLHCFVKVYGSISVNGDLIAMFCKSLRYYLSNSDLIALFCKSLRSISVNGDLIALFCKGLRYYLGHGDLIAFSKFSEKEVGYDYHRWFCFIRVALLYKSVKV